MRPFEAGWFCNSVTIEPGITAGLWDLNRSDKKLCQEIVDSPIMGLFLGGSVRNLVSRGGLNDLLRQPNWTPITKILKERQLKVRMKAYEGTLISFNGSNNWIYWRGYLSLCTSTISRSFRTATLTAHVKLVFQLSRKSATFTNQN